MENSDDAGKTRISGIEGEDSSLDDYVRRLKEEEALLRVKAENLGILIEYPQEEKEEEESQKQEEEKPAGEETDRGEQIIEEEMEEEKDRFTLFLEDVKRQRGTLGGLQEKEELDLLTESEDLLQLYTKDYIAGNLAEAQRQYDILSSMLIPEDTDILTEKKIRKNLGDFASRIREAKEVLDATFEKRAPPALIKERKSPRRGLFEEFLEKIKRFKEEYTTERMNENLVECENAFGRLLEEGKNLPTEEEPDLEEKIIANLDQIQNELMKAKRSHHEERGRLILKAIRKLKDSSQYNPTIYNNIAMKFQNIAPDISFELRDVIKEELAECYSKMKEMEAKRKEEEKKAQAEGIRVYWGTYLKKIDTFVSEIEKARPVEIMDYYLRYKKLVTEYERMNKQEISEFEVEAAQEKLDECYESLERLRLQT